MQLWSTFFSLLKICFRTINNNFNKLVLYQNNSISIYNPVNVKTLNYVVKKHIKISLLNENLNKIFYTQLILTYLAIFVEITFLLS